MSELSTLADTLARVATKAKRNMNLSTNEPQPRPALGCVKCGFTGFIETPTGAAECECQIVAREKARMERLFNSAKIPARYRGKTLDNFDATWQPQAHKVAVDYAWTWPKMQGESLFLVGPVGTGKSHLARAILVAMIQRHVMSGLAVTVPNLMDDLRPGASEDQRAEQMELLKTVPLLVLDDLGAQRTTEWVTERLFVIINARYDEMLPTIITSNVYLEDLRRIPGWDRLVDRIVEMARAVKMQPGNYRVKGKVRE